MAKTARALALALALALVPACGGGGSGGGPPPGPAREVSVVTVSGTGAATVLTGYSDQAPGTPLATLTVTGVTGTIVGIDYRPLNSTLFALSDAGQLYSINGAGGANPIGAPTALTGTAFGFDFIPTADLIRVASNAEQNLRLNPTTGASITDTALAYLPPNSAFNPDIVAVAYSNNFVGTPSTTLYAIDRSQDFLIQSPNPNGGTLQPVVSLGADITDAALDFTADNAGYAAMTRQSDGLAHLFTINLSTNVVSDKGVLGTGAAVHGMTVAQWNAFAPASGSIVALKGGNVLVNYSSSSPGAILGVLTIRGHTGSLVGIDYRPLTGELMAVSDADILYRIDPVTGDATAAGAVFTPSLTGAKFGFDVNPVADRVRVVSETDENLRLDPTNGTLVNADTALAYVVGAVPPDSNEGDNPQVVASAYTNNVAGAASTELFGIDIGQDVLVKQDPPNAGTLATRGALGVDATDASFDISSTGTAYAALTVGGVTGLYTVDLTNGTALLVGTLGTGGPVTGITVKP